MATIGLLVRRRDRATVATLFGLAAVTGYLAVLGRGMQRWPYDHWMVLVLVPALLVGGIVGIVLVTRHDTDRLTSLMIAGLFVKLAAAFIRYFVTFAVYGGGDATTYHRNGEAIAETFRAGGSTIGDIIPTATGTRFIDQLTGLVYVITGPSRLGGFLVFSFIGFWGLVLFHRAARTGMPSLDERRYASLVYFMPALMFWPSSIGKEAVMMLAIGAAALGAARLLERRRGAMIALAAGLGLAYQVRPHVAFVILVALAAAMPFRRRAGRRPPIFGPAARLLAVLTFAAVASLTLANAVDRFLPDTVDTDITAAGQLLDQAEAGTSSGGSEFERTTPASPLEYPAAVFAVLFRPTLLQADSLGNLLAALETTFVLVLGACSWRRLRRLPSLIFSEPYLLFAVVYTAVFTFAWSAFSNLGALVRQRVQVWPFVLLLLALPLVGERSNPPAQAKRR